MYITKCVVLTTLNLCFLLCSFGAGAMVRKIRIHVMDADTSATIADPTIKISPLTGLSMSHSSSEPGRFDIAIDRAADPSMILTINLGKEDYYPRDIEVFLSMIAGSIKTYDIFLAKRQTNFVYTLGHIDAYSLYISNRTDRAFALLSRAKSESKAGPGFSQFDLRLTYNLADSELKLCTEQFFATCKDAANDFALLKGKLTSYPKLFERERVLSSNLSIEEAEKFDWINTYSRAKWDLHRDEYDLAEQEFLDIRAAMGAGKISEAALRIEDGEIARALAWTRAKRESADGEASGAK